MNHETFEPRITLLHVYSAEAEGEPRIIYEKLFRPESGHKNALSVKPESQKFVSSQHSASELLYFPSCGFFIASTDHFSF